MMFNFTMIITLEYVKGENLLLYMCFIDTFNFIGLYYLLNMLFMITSER